MKRSINTKPGRPTIRSTFMNENGAALVIALMFIAILGMLGTTAYVMTSTDMQIGANYKASVQASNVAEAGVNEAIYRLGLFDDGGTNAPPSGSMINVNGLTDNNAAISVDPNGLLSNTIDDDGNGAVDDISDLNYNGIYDNRTWQTKIMLKTSDDADTTTTISTPTIQPSASWIEYSSSTDDGTALTIEYLKDTGDMDSDGNTSEIVFYDGSLATPYNVDAAATLASGQPVVVITSTGKSGGAKKTLQVAAVHQPVDIDSKAAVMVNLSPTLSGAALISGFDYDGSTTTADCAPCNAANWDVLATFKTNGVDNHGGSETYSYPNPGAPPPTLSGPSPDQNDSLHPDTTAAPANEEELDTEDRIPYGLKLEATGHKPGVWTPLASGTILPDADVFGGDDTTPWKAEAAPAWLTLAAVLGVSDAELTNILDNANVTEADMDGSGKLTVAPQGVMYINNAGGNELKLTSSTPSSTNGWGLLYVTGNVDFQSLEFRGLIYVEGDAGITGNFWLIGSMAIKGVAAGNFSSGGGTFLYSSDILKNYVNQSMKFVTLSWYDDLS